MVIEVYAPISTYSDDLLEALYEHISKVVVKSKTHFTVVMGDFNVKLGKRTNNELRMGQHEFGQRNQKSRFLQKAPYDEFLLQETATKEMDLD